jgi:hypothetical protein
MLELYRPSPRAGLAVAILIAWTASLGWLGKRQLGKSAESTLSAEATLRLAPATTWYAITAGPVQIGYAGITFDTLSPGYRITESTAIEIPAAVATERVTRRTVAWFGATLELQRMESGLGVGGHHSDWKVDVSGDTVTTRFVSATSRAQGSARFSEVPTAAVAIPYRLALTDGLAPGRTRTIAPIDGWPPSVRVIPVKADGDSEVRFADSAVAKPDGTGRVAVHFDSVRAVSVVVDAATGPVRIWIDRRGVVAGLALPLGVRWVRTDFDLSTTNFRDALPSRVDTIRQALPSVGRYAALPTGDTGLMTRRFVVSHRDGSAIDDRLLAMLTGGRQAVHGDTIIVQRIAMGHDQRTSDTLPDLMIQEHAGAIISWEHRLVRGPFTAQRLPALLASVRAAIKVDTSIDAAQDALGTLAARAGSPDGIARLMVAVLRRAGMPARYVVGVYPRGTALLTHAWVEVWAPQNGGWIAIDPASGTFANTGLIRLAFAGSSRPEEMMMQLANARVDSAGTGDVP